PWRMLRYFNRKGESCLDEIGELPLTVQPKLLRVLETQEIDRVGADRPAQVDVRVIAATNRDLSEEVSSGRFREDLYFRLSVINIRIPPLRERPRDMALLADTFMKDLAVEMRIHPPVLSPDALEILRTYAWPGNVRELRHILAAILCQHQEAVIKPEHIKNKLPKLHGLGQNFSLPAAGMDVALEETEGLDKHLAISEKRILEQARSRFDTQKEMARFLKLSEARLHRLLKKHGLARQARNAASNRTSESVPAKKES
ncbi:sigma 54-interacting transcriptional regulator, partial [Acidobacteriota bacterium]